MKFTLPNPFNGETFIKDLLNENVKIERFYIDGENNLIVFGNEKDKTKIENLLKTHDGADSVRVDFKLSAIAKLKTLGLTEEEIAAL
jgi:hypothetical protein